MLSAQAPLDAPAALSYTAFVVSILTPLIAGGAAYKRNRSRREIRAGAGKTEAEAGSISSGITLEGWRESRQEVHDARNEAREARKRAEAMGERLDACEVRADAAEAENRRLRAQLAEMQAEIDVLRASPRRPPEDP